MAGDGAAPTTISTTAVDHAANGAQSPNGKPQGATSGRQEGHEAPPWTVLLTCLVVAVALLGTYGTVLRNGGLLLTLLMVAAASLLVGGMLGFLFGIPRAGIRQDDNAKPQEPSNSLEQVADWLTKILVGAGLVELTSLGGALDRFGKAVAPAQAGAAIVAEASAVLFAILGFGASYLWTRTTYGGIQARADRDVSKVFQQQLQDIKETAEAAKQLAEGVKQDSEEVARTQSEVRDLAELNRDILRGDVKVGPSMGATAASGPPTQRPFDGYPQELLDKIEIFREQSTNAWDSDPNAALFAGAPRQKDGRRIEASIVKVFPTSLRIALRVQGLAGAAPLNSPVVFLLHPTYDDNRISVVQPNNNVASDEVLSEGEFTVVAICDAGKTVLAFPLSDLPGAPDWFLEQ